jgi:hypothetical protein
LDKDLSRELIKSSTKGEVTWLIREAFKQTPQISRGSEVDLPLLVNLATILPVDLPLQSAMVIQTFTQEDFSLRPICDCIGSTSQPLVLLVKGLALDSQSSDLDNAEIVLGAFLPQERRQSACIFQLSPGILALFSDTDAVDLESDTGTDKLLIQMQAAELALDERTRTGRMFIPGGDSRLPASSWEIKITSMDLVGFTAIKGRMEMC